MNELGDNGGRTGRAENLRLLTGPYKCAKMSALNEVGISKLGMVMVI